MNSKIQNRSTATEWRCRNCGRKLGSLDHPRLHIRFARGPQYLVPLPVQAVCWKCDELNELTSADVA